MLGFIKKDLFLVKNNLKSMILFIFILMIVLLTGEDNIGTIPVFISVVLFMSTFSYDEYNKWDAYAITIPNGRKKVVISKYITTIILLVISILLTILLSILIGIIHDNLNMEKIMMSALGSLLAISLIISIDYPLIFKYGNEKGRNALFIITCGIVVVATTFFKNIKISSDLKLFLDQYGVLCFTMVSIALIFISYYISNKIYQNREY